MINELLLATTMWDMFMGNVPNPDIKFKLIGKGADGRRKIDRTVSSVPEGQELINRSNITQLGVSLVDKTGSLNINNAEINETNLQRFKTAIGRTLGGVTTAYFIASLVWFLIAYLVESGVLLVVEIDKGYFQGATINIILLMLAAAIRTTVRAHVVQRGLNIVSYFVDDNSRESFKDFAMGTFAVSLMYGMTRTGVIYTNSDLNTLIMGTVLQGMVTTYFVKKAGLLSFITQNARNPINGDGVINRVHCCAAARYLLTQNHFGVMLVSTVTLWAIELALLQKFGYNKASWITFEQKVYGRSSTLLQDSGSINLYTQLFGSMVQQVSVYASSSGAQSRFVGAPKEENKTTNQQIQEIITNAQVNLERGVPVDIVMIASEESIRKLNIENKEQFMETLSSKVKTVIRSI